jgi:hypothetical protein
MSGRQPGSWNAQAGRRPRHHCCSSRRTGPPPAFAVSKTVCNGDAEDGCAFASIVVLSDDGIRATAQTSGWYCCGVAVNFKVLWNGATYWNNHTLTCTNQTFCSHPTIDLPNCAPGLYTSRSRGWRIGYDDNDAIAKASVTVT